MRACYSLSFTHTHTHTNTHTHTPHDTNITCAATNHMVDTTHRTAPTSCRVEQEQAAPETRSHHILCCLIRAPAGCSPPQPQGLVRARIGATHLMTASMHMPTHTAQAPTETLAGGPTITEGTTMVCEHTGARKCGHAPLEHAKITQNRHGH